MNKDEESMEMWFNRNNPNNLTVTSPPSPVFTLFGSQNDNVESQLCSDLSRMTILNDQGIGTSRGPQQQQQHQHQHHQGFMNINKSHFPSWVHLDNNFVSEPIGPPPPRHNQQSMAKRTFPKEQTFGKSQLDSSYGGFTNSYYLFSPAPAPAPGAPPPLCYREIQIPQRRQIIRSSSPLAFECDNNNNSYIILKNETMRRCRSICGATRRNRFHGESSKIIGIDFKQQQQKQQGMAMPSYEILVRPQGSMFEMAKDQNGCRLLQNSFDGENIQNMEIVFNGIIDNVVPLMMDPFGNYLVQKLLDFCFDYQRLKIVIMLTKKPGQLVTISLNPHGTRVVQKLIKTLKTNMEIQLVRSAIQPGFLQLIKDPNGNHVIQSCLLYLSVQDNEFIFDAATEFCVNIATHKHGCCVLQRCIEYSKGNSRDKLVKEICKHGLQLARDEYGNYVVQFVIKMENLSSSTKFTLIAQFKGNYVDLSKQKFSSHVVETCLDYIPESRDTIVHELRSVEEFDHLMQHPFANYVIQSALSVTKGHLHRTLAEAVRQHKKLHTSPYCKKIFSKNLLKK